MADTKPPVKREPRKTNHVAPAFFTDRRIAVLVTFLALVVGSVAAVSVGGLYQGRDNATVLDRVEETNRIIKDSVDPTGQRFQRGQAQTAEAVSAINDITVLAVFCGKQYAALLDVQGCVRAEWARSHPPTTTTVPR